MAQRNDPKRPGEFKAQMSLPMAMVDRSNEALYFGAELGSEGYSPFVAVMTVGAYTASDGRKTMVLAAAGYRENTDFPEGRAVLIAKLKEVLSDLEDVTRAQGQVAS